MNIYDDELKRINGLMRESMSKFNDSNINQTKFFGKANITSKKIFEFTGVSSTIINEVEIARLKPLEMGSFKEIEKPEGNTYKEIISRVRFPITLEDDYSRNTFTQKFTDDVTMYLFNEFRNQISKIPHDYFQGTNFTTNIPGTPDDYVLIIQYDYSKYDKVEFNPHFIEFRSYTGLVPRFFK